MAIQYDTLGSTVTINAEGTTTTIAPADGIAIVGGYDANNADSSTTAGEATKVNGPTDARTAFGSDCELTRVIETMGGVDTIYGVPVSETQTTESFTSTSSDTLTENPVFDPQVHPEHDITAQDTSAGTSVDVSIVYVDQGSMSPGTDEITLNPHTGEWKADSSSSYDITHAYGDYQTAIDTAVAQPVRYVVVLTEEAGHKSYTVTQLQNEADNFNFRRAFVGGDVNLATADISSYTPDSEDWRLIEVIPPRGQMADGNVRTMGAVAALAARQPLDSGGSITYDQVSGIESVDTEYSDTEADDFTQVTALTRDLECAGGFTTSTDSAFRDIFAVEIVDRFAELAYAVAKSYAGGPNTPNQRKNLRASLVQIAKSMADSQPPALATGDGGQPYDIQTTVGATDDVTDVTAAIEPAPIMKEVNLTINVGDVVVNQGVNA